MHGFIFLELQRFIVSCYAEKGVSKWFELLSNANLSGHLFVATKTYPDEDAMNIISIASHFTGLPKAKLLEKFGEFIIPDLMKMFRMFIEAGWKTLDFLEHTESTIHKVVRIAKPDAEPPELKIKRTSDTEIEILYYSKRQIPELAIGMIKAVAKHYNETVLIKMNKTDLITYKITVQLIS